MRIATVAREAEHRLACSAAIASRSTRRCPTIPIPISLRSSAVTFGRTIFVDLVVAESRLIPLKAKAPQLTPDIHGCYLNGQPAIIFRAQRRPGR